MNESMITRWINLHNMAAWGGDGTDATCIYEPGVQQQSKDDDSSDEPSESDDTFDIPQCD